MDVNDIIDNFFTKDKVSELLEMLKTCKWNKLSTEDKKNFFVLFNKAFCKYMGIKEMPVVFSDDFIKVDDYIRDHYYSNLRISDNGQILIEDVNYNQYLTLYEYFVKMMEEYQMMVCNNSISNDIDSLTKERWNLNLSSTEFAYSKVDFYIYEGDPLHNYQYLKMDAREVGESLLFYIVRSNYNDNDSCDEQFFMSNNNILENDNIINKALSLVDNLTIKKQKILGKMHKISEKIKVLEYKDLSLVKDEYLIIALYPEISAGMNKKLLIRVYKELADRVLDKEVNIALNKDTVLFNGRSFSFKQFRNNFLNILIYEMMKEIDCSLKKDEELVKEVSKLKSNLSDSIVEYKKKRLYNLLNELDSCINPEDYDVIHYQPLSKLVVESKLYENLLKSSNGRNPFSKRGK